MKSPTENEFLWLISLSDLMILLFVLFVVLFSFSYQRQGQKMTPADLARISATLTGKRSQQGITLDEIQKKLLKWVIDRNLLSSVEIHAKEDSLILQIREKLLFDPGQYVIKSESMDLIQGISQALSKVPAPFRLGIEGHTDDQPLARPRASARVVDNWELSTERALAVLRALHLTEDQLMRTVVMGYGPTHPIVPNRDKKNRPIGENQMRNRRVTIRIF